MYIQNPEVAHFFWVNLIPSTKKIEVFSRELTHYGELRREWILLLWNEQTLYNYPLQDVHAVYEKIWRDILMILCTGLSRAKWSWKREWINTQNNVPNFNMNLCLPIRESLSKNIWNLQERISVAIANVLNNYSWDQAIAITYPFHYTMDWGKVAGHLVQKMNIDNNSSFLRIGIGVNTADIAPELPQNDNLVGQIFTRPTSIKIPSDKWVDLAMNFYEAIHSSLDDRSKHDEYMEYLNLKKWDHIAIYQDDGSNQFSRILYSDNFKYLDTEGNIITNSHTIWWDHHIVKL